MVPELPLVSFAHMRRALRWRVRDCKLSMHFAEISGNMWRTSHKQLDGLAMLQWPQRVSSHKHSHSRLFLNGGFRLQAGAAEVGWWPSEMRYVPGSAIGVRVVSGIWSSFIGGMISFWLVLSNPSLVWWLFVALPILVSLRSWWLGVFLTDDGFIVKSWFRTYRFSSAQVERVDLMEVYSALLGAGLKWIPFVGAVRMIQVDVVDKWSPYWFSVTLGRRNRVLRIVRSLREHTKAPSGGDLTV